MNANCPFRPLLFSVDWREIHTRVPYKKGIPYGCAEKVKASIRKCLWWPKSGLVELRDFQRRENVWISYDREFTFSFFFFLFSFRYVTPNQVFRDFTPYSDFRAAVHDLIFAKSSRSGFLFLLVIMIFLIWFPFRILIIIVNFEIQTR